MILWLKGGGSKGWLSRAMDESLFESPEAFLLFKQALAQAEGEDDPREQPVDGIPPFYFGDPLRPNACVPLRTASREKHLNHKTNEAVDNKELESLWHELAGSGKDEKPLVMGDDTDSKVWAGRTLSLLPPRKRKD